LKSKPITDQVLESLARNPACAFNTLVAECSEFTWNQLFYEVDRLSRIGQLYLTSVGGGHYFIRLAFTEVTMRAKQPHTRGNASQDPAAGRPDGEVGSVESVNRHLRIAQRAYQYFEEQGRQDGHALDHWLKAEREIRSAAPQKTS
jgi:hypothetical protein